MRILLLVVALLGTCGCRTRVVTSPASALDAAPAFARPTRAWEVVDASRVVGMVVEFDEPGGRRFFSVRNAWHQELGLVDAMGRAWRYRPHEREAEWLGSGSLPEGAARVLDLEGELELIEVRVEALREEGRAVAAASAHD